jgi:hypothetical protein
MPLPSADIPVPLALLPNLWRVVDLRARCRRPRGLDTGFSLPGRVRGALGHALRRATATDACRHGAPGSRAGRPGGLPDAFAALYGKPVMAPAVEGGALFHNPTRPYLLLTEDGGAFIDVVVRLFGFAAVWSPAVRAGLADALSGGVSVAPGSRVRVRLEVEGVERTEPHIRYQGRAAPHAAHLTFLTPAALGREGALAVDAPVILGGLVSRVAGLAAWHGLVLDDDWEALDRASSLVSLDSGGLRPFGFERVSVAQGRRVPMLGLLGTAQLDGPLGSLAPVLALAPWIHLGAHTTFGMGRCAVVILP